MTPLLLFGQRSASFFQMYTWESSLAAIIYLPFAVREAEIWLVAFRKPTQNLQQFDQQENKYILKTCFHLCKFAEEARMQDHDFLYWLK